MGKATRFAWERTAFDALRRRSGAFRGATRDTESWTQSIRPCVNQSEETPFLASSGKRRETCRSRVALRPGYSSSRSLIALDWELLSLSLGAMPKSPRAARRGYPSTEPAHAVGGLLQRVFRVEFPDGLI